VKAAKAAGATFGVSPGATDRLIAACEDEGLPLLPGAATASEIMALLEKGYTVQKFFPAEQAGGAAYLKSIGSPIPQVSFCPTGGISLKIAPDYLGLKNILCVGGSWVAPKDAMARGDWAAITTFAREAAALPRSASARPLAEGVHYQDALDQRRFSNSCSSLPMPRRSPS
jgi:2-dehydro-3-deoxyphosphogluconate aldolase / (4S)-4-hydroxy-2-oxoglutarate aldolase